MELGFFTLGDLLTDIETGVRVSKASGEGRLAW
jgi:hypothetical protein